VGTIVAFEGAFMKAFADAFVYAFVRAFVGIGLDPCHATRKCLRILTVKLAVALVLSQDIFPVLKIGSCANPFKYQQITSRAIPKQSTIAVYFDFA
jgi:hypothetical protein